MDQGSLIRTEEFGSPNLLQKLKCKPERGKKKLMLMNHPRQKTSSTRCSFIKCKSRGWMNITSNLGNESLGRQISFENLNHSSVWFEDNQCIGFVAKSCLGDLKKQNEPGEIKTKNLSFENIKPILSL
ncbi:hypothetical protein CEXT_286011 [Caerostris extrusa]|uniref:Uncharacterized protein n=1 Tax=Caerostris extrusa TaxID=172846 RepID=A0AAV4QZT5_CAEEX|nr:hypothetical protein CEXT_286011 [Caerostris extrusa]